MGLQSYSARGVVREWGDVDVYHPHEVDKKIAAMQVEIDKKEEKIVQILEAAREYTCVAMTSGSSDDKRAALSVFMAFIDEEAMG